MLAHSNSKSHTIEMLMRVWTCRSQSLPYLTVILEQCYSNNGRNLAPKNTQGSPGLWSGTYTWLSNHKERHNKGNYYQKGTGWKVTLQGPDSGWTWLRRFMPWKNWPFVWELEKGILNKNGRRGLHTRLNPSHGVPKKKRKKERNKNVKKPPPNATLSILTLCCSCCCVLLVT